MYNKNIEPALLLQSPTQHLQIDSLAQTLLSLSLLRTCLMHRDRMPVRLESHSSNTAIYDIGNGDDDDNYELAAVTVVGFY